MRQKVCMFVWNHFTNDARVLRECTALSENGYSVDLICIHDPNNPKLPKFEKRNDHFTISRVERYPKTLQYIQSLLRLLKRNKPLFLLPFISWLALMFLSPVWTSITSLVVGLCAVLLVKTKLRKLWVAGSVIMRMIIKGYSSKYDIYHANDLNTLPQAYFTSKWRIKKKKLIYDSHEVQTSRTGYESPIHGKIEAFLIKKIDSMIVENHTRAKYNEELYGFYPNVVHNYPFSLNESAANTIKAPLHKILGISEQEKILLYQGGIQTGRGLEKLIDAFPDFVEGILVFIGDGRIKPVLEKKVKEMKLEEKVKFLPKVPLNELPSYTVNAYLGFQVLNNVCFNHYSASSNKLFEYMMAGVPVVACDFPEIKRVVEGEQVGISIDSHDPKAIASGVNELILNEKRYLEAKANTSSGRLKYNWELEQDHLLSVYHSQKGSA